MQEIRYPYFNKDRILKIAMLENLRDFPRDEIDIRFHDYTDGILCGFHPVVEKDCIVFSKGMAKFKGSVYTTSSPMAVPYFDNEKLVIMKLCFQEAPKNPDFFIMGVSILLDEEISLAENQLELCRFQLKAGAYLRWEYTDLFDFATIYNTVDCIDAQYAGVDKKTVYPALVRYFAKEALKCRTQNPIDIPFCMLCLNSAAVQRDTIESYISYRMQDNSQGYSNREIHSRLVQILDEIRQEQSLQAKKQSAKRKIILD